MFVLPRALVLLCMVVVPGALARPSTGMSTALAASCPADVVVLGADLSAAGRAEVTKRLGAPSPRTASYLQESLADERTQARGLVPPSLLGLVAISSARLTRRADDEGLTVRTDPTITLDTARLYAHALVTAGVRHAFVAVTAPVASPALGTTALLGLLRAARAACLEVSPSRAALAVRELVLASHVAASYGPGPAAALLDAAMRGAAAYPSTDRAAQEAIVARAIAAAGTPLRPITRATLLSLLADMAAARSRGADLLAPAPVRGSPPYLAEVAAPPPHAAAAPLAPRALTGVAAGVAAGTLIVLVGGHSRRLGHVPGRLVVTRNGQPAALDDVRRGDRITTWVDASNRMVRVNARGPGVVPPGMRKVITRPSSLPPAEQGVVTSSGRGVLAYTVVRSGAPRAGQGLVVTRNGRPATLAALRAGDTVTVYRDAGGRLVRVDARSPAAVGEAPVIVRGTLTVVASHSVVVAEDESGRVRTLGLSGSPAIRRDGRSGLAPTALHSGDAVTVTVDRGGIARAVDARSRVVTAPRGAVGQRPGSGLLAALEGLAGALVLVALLVVLWARGRPLPFVIAERRRASPDDAAPAAPFKLLREARVVCLDGEVGRVVHAVLDPATGALVRLIVRDRSGVLREVPAHLIIALDLNLVRLDILWPDLQTLVQQRPPFSRRRYKRLPQARRRHTQPGVTILTSPRTLHVETTGDVAAAAAP